MKIYKDIIKNYKIKLEGQKVYLRNAIEEDAEYIESMWTDPETMKEVGGPVETSKTKIVNWLNKENSDENNKGRYFLIFNKEEEAVGEVSFHSFNEDTKTANFNIKVAAAYRGKGYSKEAITLILSYYFNRFGGLIMKDDVARNNIKGQETLKSFGFIHNHNVKENYQVIITKEIFNEIDN